MKAEYALLLFATLLFPLILSFDRNIRLFANRRRLILSIAAVLLVYGGWDVLAAQRGHWTFNPAYVFGPAISGLPIEEWMFFVVIPFTAIFTWEAAKYFERRRKK